MEIFNICLTAVSLLFLATQISAYSDIIPDLVKHIERLDAKIAQLEEQHRHEIEELREESRSRETKYYRKLSELSSRVDDLNERNDALTKEIRWHRAKWLKESMDQKAEESAPNTVHSSWSKRKDMNGKMMNRIEEITQSEKVNPKRALLSDLNVAFSAYMDHDANSLGPGQTLIYNQVLLNDGNGYNKHSGIFTAPVGGVYSFSFFIGQRDVHNEWVALWVNSENKVEAAVDTYHTTQDLQGGNTVNLKLTSGDVVYIKNLADGHVEGSKTSRLTSFSGFLIYPVESTTVVG